MQRYNLNWMEKKLFRFNSNRRNKGNQVVSLKTKTIFLFFSFNT